MKAAGIRSAVLLAIMLIAASGVRTDCATGYFDDYGNIPWNEEKIRLDNFAIFLPQNAGYTGYIGYRIGLSDSPTRVKKRIARVKNYLIKVRKVASERLVVVDVGKRSETQTILQPVLSTLPPPFDKELVATPPPTSEF